MGYFVAALPLCVCAANIVGAELKGTFNWKHRAPIDRDSKPTEFYNNLLLAVILFGSLALAWSALVLY